MIENEDKKIVMDLVQKYGTDEIDVFLDLIKMEEKGEHIKNIKLLFEKAQKIFPIGTCYKIPANQEIKGIQFYNPLYFAPDIVGNYYIKSNGVKLFDEGFFRVNFDFIFYQKNSKLENAHSKYNDCCYGFGSSNFLVGEYEIAETTDPFNFEMELYYPDKFSNMWHITKNAHYSFEIGR